MKSAQSATQARRLIRAQNFRGFVFALLAISITGILGAPSWSNALLLVPSLALAAVLLLTDREGSPNRPLMAASAVVGTATLGWAALAPGNAIGAAGIGITAGVWIAHQRLRRMASLVTSCLVIPAIASLALTTGGPDAVGNLVLLTSIGIGWVFAVVETDNQYRLVDLLERAKDAEQELSILRERTRFAADLHDIQGHTLHVIKLKAAVARKLQHSDPDRTAQELQAIERLTAETIDQARSLADSTHTLVLAAELANAVELFGAAGIDTRVERPQSEPVRHESEFALTLREATTNILRHARATRVDILIAPDALVIRNDGARSDTLSPLRGLSTLGDRIRDAGGVLDVEHEGASFTVSVTFEPAPS